MPCLDANTVNAFAEGLLSPAEAARVEQHLDECPECRVALGALCGPKPVHDTVLEPTVVGAPLPVGARLGRYRLLAKLGQGGMGVVYKAEDEQLGRLVALKVLPAGATADPERRRRLVREARAAAAVVHPSVAVVFEAAEEHGVVFIAMEYVDGATLRTVLDRGPLAVAEALRLALAVAEGLAHAHRAGVVHRDLKPENVMLAGDQVKILDFGLAKLAARDGEDIALGSTCDPMTREGAILGTPAYMSPEQARGVAVDHRSDVFSFGILLYELVAARAPFGGVTPFDVAAAIVREPTPPLLEANPDVPAELERIVSKCLEKDPRDRYQDTADLVVDLKRLQRDSGRVSGRVLVTPPPAPPRRGRATPWLAMAGGVAALAAVAIVATRPWRAPPPRAAVASASRPPRSPELRRLTANALENTLEYHALSPDGKLLAYVAGGRLYLLVIDTQETTRLPWPEASIFGVAWFADGTRLLVTTARKEAWSLGLYSGARTKVRAGVDGLAVPSPDGKRIAYVADEGGVWVAPLAGEEPPRLIEAPARRRDDHGVVAWSPDGRRLAWVRWEEPRGILMVAEVDRPAPIVLVEDPALRNGAAGGLAWLRDGRLGYVRTAPTGAELWALGVDRTTGAALGKPQRVLALPGRQPWYLSGAAGGGRLAFLDFAPQHDVYLADLTVSGGLGPPRRLTLDDRHDAPLGWSRDGRSVLFRSNRRGGWSVFRQGLDGSDPEHVASFAGGRPEGAATPDAGELLLWELPDDGSAASGDRPPRLTLMSVADGSVRLVALARPELKLAPRAARCARVPGRGCILAEILPNGHVVFSGLDPARGRGARVAELVGAGGWDLAPSGERIAVIQDNRIALVTLATGAVSPVAPEERCVRQEVAWAADERSLFVTCNDSSYHLQRVRLDGRSQSLLDTRHGWIGDLRPSPDGRRLAFRMVVTRFDAWLVEDVDVPAQN